MKTVRMLALALVAGLALSSTSFAAPPAAKVAPGQNTTVQPAQPSTPAPAPAVAAKAKINLNDPGLTVEQLDTLPGIGEPRAKTILASRAKDGAFIDKQDLVKRGIIPQSVFDGLKDQVALVDVNNTCEADLKAILDGVGDGRAAAIVLARKKSPFSAIDGIKAVGIPDAAFAKMAHELVVTPPARKPWACLVK